MTKVRASVLLLSILARPALAERQVTARTGRVEFLYRGGTRWAEIHETPRPIEPGDRLRAQEHSSARIVLEGGAVLELFPRGDFLLRDGNELEQVVELLGGAVRVTQPRGNSSGLEIRTPAGSIHPVWGECFVQQRTDGQVYVKAKKGSVRVRGADGLTSTLSLGEMALLRLPSASPPPLPKEDGRPTGDILELLEALETNPDDLEIRTQLNDGVMDAYLGHVRRFGSLDSPLTPDGRAEMLRRTYRRLAARVEDEAVQDVFLQGYHEFEAGRYFTAVERFLLCRLLRPRDAWVGEALEEYLARQLPARIALRARSMPAETASNYRSAFASLMRLDWRAAGDELRRATDAPDEDRGLGGGERMEFRELSKKLLARAAGMGDSANAQTQTMEVVRDSEADPEGAVEAIERVLLRFNAQQGEAWWQKAAEGLRRGYVNRELHRMTLKANGYYEGNDFKSATKVLLALLQRSPGHPGAMDLLEKIQARYDENSVATRRAQEVALKAVEGARAAESKLSGSRPAPLRAAAPAVVREEMPDLKALIQAEAYYHRGLKAYLHGDLQSASEEWRSALRLNPGHEASSRALSRVLKEADATKIAGGGR